MKIRTIGQSSHDDRNMGRRKAPIVIVVVLGKLARHKVGNGRRMMQLRVCQGQHRVTDGHHVTSFD